MGLWGYLTSTKPAAARVAAVGMETFGHNRMRTSTRSNDVDFENRTRCYKTSKLGLERSKLHLIIVKHSREPCRNTAGMQQQLALGYDDTWECTDLKDHLGNVIEEQGLRIISALGNIKNHQNRW